MIRGVLIELHLNPFESVETYINPHRKLFSYRNSETDNYLKRITVTVTILYILYIFSVL